VTHARASNDRDRNAARALSDAALVDAMRASVPEAWSEFDARFRPLLERYAARIGIPRWEWSCCITEVLDDEALRLIERSREMPQQLSAYLIRAVRNRHLVLKRAATRRDTRYASAAAADASPAGSVGPLVSEHTRRACEPPRVSEERQTPPSGVTRLAELLSARLSEEERQMLAWVAEGVPQRVIGDWLGINREAAKKRIARLCRRLRGAAAELRGELPPETRREIDRLLYRAGEKRGDSQSGESDDR
jgi:DNA-directed RNA polymerase specialized sigma24 family protein